MNELLRRGHRFSAGEARSIRAAAGLLIHAAAFLCCASSFSIARGESPALEDAGTHYDRAVELEAAGEFDAALIEFRRSLEMNSDSARANYNLGLALLGSFRRTLELRPGDPGFPADPSTWTKGPLGEAIEHFHRALELDPTLASAHAALGDALWFASDLEAGIESYRHAVELDPDSVARLLLLARALMANGDPDGAILAYRRALELDPTNPVARTGLEKALLIRDGRPPAAGSPVGSR